MRDEASPDLVTIRYLSELTGLSTKAIRGMIQTGKLLKDIHYFKRGGRIMIDYHKFMAYFREEKVDV